MRDGFEKNFTTAVSATHGPARRGCAPVAKGIRRQPMTRPRLALIAGAVALLAGVFAVTGVPRAAKSVDTLNPSTPSAMKGPNIQQPLNYSHEIHAGKLGMD